MSIDAPSVGVTGTQVGMTDRQQAAFTTWLSQRRPGVLHHGDCVGADAQAHAVAAGMGWLIEVHPPEISAKRAFCKGDRTHPTAPYLVRNRAIVDASEVMVAFPKSTTEELRSGTWATIRHARRQGRQLVIFWPDGTSTVDPEVEGRRQLSLLER